MPLPLTALDRFRERMDDASRERFVAIRRKLNRALGDGE
jgi:hypothetical protein